MVLQDIDDQVLQAIDQQEIILHYQPVIDLGTLQPVGCEALCRWRREGEMVPPGTFLPYLSSQTLSTLTIYLAQVVVGWLDRCPGWIALNLRSTPLTEGLIDQLSLLVPEKKRSRFVLELTEQDAFQTEVISALLRHEFPISIDDWGTGFNNLSTLIEYPSRYLKLDKTLTAGVTFSPTHAKVCRFAISLAHEIGAIPIAEGIETKGQYDFVRLNGCILGQGWFLGHPEPSPCKGTPRCHRAEDCIETCKA